ncbi:MAG: xylose isomerase [Saprospiraceae bacterium]|nr:MAG: xylose isomerase [Saprospiraceae bacterium]
MKRRTFIHQSGQIVAGASLLYLGACANAADNKTTKTTVNETEMPQELFFKISLAQWSLHRTLRNGQLQNLDFAATARNDFGIEGIEYVNQFFKDKAKDMEYLAEMKKRAEDNGVESLLIMVDGEGNLGEMDDAKRKISVENHFKWVDAAHFLGCHSIRVNAGGAGTMPEVAKAAAQSLGEISDYASKAGLNVIVENHGGYSSNGEWLAGVMKAVGKPNCGTLPDFGNFCIQKEADKCIEEYDRYKGVTELMPFAKAVSAKSHDFGENGQEIHTDYAKMLKIVKDAGYSGFIGIEYEGSGLSEVEGIKATKALLESAGKMIG